MDHEDVLNKLVPYRLQAVEVLAMAWEWSYEWTTARELHVLVDRKLVLHGNTNALVNPMLEAGLIHARALLEFLGLQARHGKLSAIKAKDRRPDDFGVERFLSNGNPLPMVSPETAISTYEGDPVIAERALLSIIDISNKGFAHFSKGLSKGKWNSEDVLIACKGIPILVINHLYVPLGLSPPEYKIDVSRPAES